MVSRASRGSASALSAFSSVHVGSRRRIPWFISKLLSVGFVTQFIRKRGFVMPRTQRKTELSPVEALVVERRLHEEARSSTSGGALMRIQMLTKERQKLYAKSAAHPFLAPANRTRILAISAEIELLWEALRRERAARRTQMERALNVTPVDDEQPRAEPAVTLGTIDAA
jgi:hypothetical protein